MDNSKPAPRPEPNLALITPSASPPSRSFFPQPYRIPDQASPTKRPRLSSAPRQLPARASSSSSSAADVADLHKAREESTLRLLDVWAGLAEQYNIPPEEDDIIDIRTGKVVKDRGVLRGSRTLSFGAFAAAAAEDEEGEAEEDNEEDEVDELDSFAQAEMPDIDLGADERKVPPVTEMDPRDAEDLREFLEAERKRKELYGYEVDETEGSVYESQGEEVYPEDSQHEPTDDDANPEVDEEDDVSHQLDDGRTPPQPVEPVYVDSGSDDELANWEQDEATAVYSVAKKEDSDSEVEILEPSPKGASLSPEIPVVPLTSTKTKSRGVSERPSFATQRQLQTPPQSHTSSSIPSATPDDYFVQLPPDSSSPPRSPSPSSSRYDSSPIKSQQVRQHSSKPRPERKKSEKLDLDSTPPIPRLDLSKISKDPSRAKSKSRATSHTPAASGSASISLSTAKKGPKQSALAEAKVAQEPRKKPNVEVVIEQRTPFRPRKTSITPTEGKKSDAANQKVKGTPKPAISTKAKGKQKTTSADEPVDSFPEAVDTTPASPPAARTKTPHSPRSRSRRSSLSNFVLSKEAGDRLHEHANATSRYSKYSDLAGMESASMAGKKRKRIVSTAETDMVTNEAPPPESSAAQPGSRNPSTSRARHHSSDGGSPGPDYAKAPEVKQKGKWKSTSKPRSRSSDYEAGGDSSQEEYEKHQQRHFSRAPSHFGDHPYYPYPPPTYPPPHRHDQQPPPHMYAPIPDPRAQFIITQAMQQLSALVGGAWTPPHAPPPPGVPVRGSTPYTPSHYRHYRPDAPSSMYSTPTHHAHPYPYSYNPDMSNATLPPDSPDVRSSSPPAASGSGTGGIRQKSILRGQSRGRRVSFRIEEGVVDTMEMPVSPDARHDDSTESRSRQRAARNYRGQSRSPPREHASEAQNRRKGKEKPRREPSETHSEAESEAPSRGRPPTVRGRTPGPPAHGQDARSSTQVPAGAIRGRSRGPARK
ncbi:hypothetical protein LshimejAT787_0503760 [Lyophyllum shimeji]|uniref:Uncharacterized protein n=1 Tax=Lyophyllum shimeji TaxID=47721 RepID=A0A9P3PMR2_LYOSH|nr:hypothetical protein LshimejAT787_0503760 [Lyophyllum shimeji]